MKPKDIQKVEVIWQDASSYSGKWMERIDAGEVEPCIVSTLGHMIRCDKEYIVIAQNSRIGCDSVGCLMEIPTKYIKSIRKVR